MMSGSGITRWFFSIPLLSLAVYCLLGCGVAGSRTATDPGVANAESRKLVVVAPHVTTRALGPIHESFLRDHPGVEIELKAAMVDDMVDEMEAKGGQGDVLIMMDGPEMKIIQSAGITNSSRKLVWATCPVVMVAPEGNPKNIRSINDLLRPDISRIAIPDPERDSTGAAFAAALRGSGIWAEIEHKVIIAASPHTACTAVEHGEADTAVTYSPCVLFGHSESTLCLAAFLPEEFCGSATIAAAPFASTTNPLVDDYLDNLLKKESQAIVGRVGFEPVNPPSPADADNSLLVPCGAGLQPPMDEIGDAYFNRTAIRVDFTYAGAGMLLANLNSTRRGDLYIPGESFYVDLARQRGFIAETRPVVYFLPVIIVRQGNPKNIRTLNDLARPGLRIAIGDPEALAVGPVTQRMLKRAGLLEAVEKNVSMQAGCIPELANAVSMRAADAGIVWDAIAHQHDKHVDAVPIAPQYNEVAEVCVATLTCSKQPGEARKLMAFIASEEAAAVFHKHGFNTHKPEGVRLASEAAASEGR